MRPRSQENYDFIGIYGWSTNPLVEYYVIENGFWTTPPIVPTVNLPKGVYLLRFQADGSAPETRKLLLE
jgi:hypothetical protein